MCSATAPQRADTFAEAMIMSTLAAPTAQVGQWPAFKSLPLRLIFRPIGWLVARLRKRYAIRQLQRLDDRLLADIGLRRAGIAEAVRSGRR